MELEFNYRVQDRPHKLFDYKNQIINITQENIMCSFLAHKTTKYSVKECRLLQL
jgi:hypothetical protein